MNDRARRGAPVARFAAACTAAWFGMASVCVPACGSHHDARGASAASAPNDRDASASSEQTSRTSTSASNATGERELDLLPVLTQGSIDAAGPIVDFGEPQADPFVVPPLPLRSQNLNGDSWATVGPRVRVRVPIDPNQPPTHLRLRVRRVHARAVLAVIDGVPTRQAALPNSPTPIVVTVPLVPERFRREISDVELRFLGVERPGTITVAGLHARPAMVTQTQRVVVRVHGRRRVITRTVTRPAAPHDSTPPAALDLDWIHLVHGEEVASVRVNDLVADAHAEGPPRRALTMYSPTSVSVVTVMPPAPRLRASVAAEGIRGRTRTSSVRARVRIEADGIEPIETALSVTPGTAWQDIDLDLRATAGRATRITFAALDGGDTRLAFAEPRILSRSSVSHTPPPTVRRVVLVVVRGARWDRFSPTVSPRFTAGGFARLAHEGLLARAIAPSPRELAAFASAVTGLGADVHGMLEPIDTLDEHAPTIPAALRDAGIATAAFSDDAWFLGSGLDRGFTERQSCPNDAATCHAETMFTRAADWLVAQGDRRTFVLIATRAGLPPLDAPTDLLTAIDPSTDENQLTSEQTGQFAARHAAVTLDTRTMHRLDAMYDASLAGVDRALSHLLDRLRDASQLGTTAIVVVGDRGVSLGESGLVGDGPMTETAISQTLLLVRTPGAVPTQLSEPVSVLDGVATALERLEGPMHPEVAPSDRPRSVFTPEPGGLHPRGVVFIGSLRGDPGLRFGNLIALSRGAGPLALFEPEDDPLGQHDVAADHPIALAFAHRVLAAHRAALAAGENASDAAAPGPVDRGESRDEHAPEVLRRYPPSTRVLPPNVEAWLRGSGQLGR